MRTGTFNYQEKEQDFNYYDVLTASQRLRIIANVCNTVTSSGMYLPMFKWMAIKYYLIKECCPGLDLSMVEYTETNQDGLISTYPDWDEVEIFSSETDIFDVVSAGLEEQFLEILENINDNLAFMTGIDKANVGNEVVRLLKTVNSMAEKMNAQKAAGFDSQANSK